MSLWQPLRKLWKKSRNRRTPLQVKRQRAARPQVEGLEDRLLMTLSPVDNTSSFPWRAVVRLEIDYPNMRNRQCSGAMFDEFHVLTAGHCVYSREYGGWATSIKAIPGQARTQRPYGEAWGTRFLAFTAWINNGDRQHDMGLITLDRTLGSRTGWFAYDTGTTTALNSAGYPSPPFEGNRMYHTYGRVNFTTNTIPYVQGGGFEAHGGQSGSPMWRYDGRNQYIHGVVTTTGQGVRLTADKNTALRNAMQADRRPGSCPAGIRCVAGGGAGGTPADRPDLTDADQWFGTSSAGFSVSTVRPGGSFRVNAGVYNLGLASGGSFVVSFYALTQPNINSTRYLIGQTTIPSLSAFSQTSVLWNGTLPVIPTGQYYLGWVIDSANSQTEYDESNNTGILGRMQFSVLPANRAPVAVSDAYALDEDTPLNIVAAGVLANDRDPDGNILRAILASGPTHGTLTLRPDGSFTYVPRANFHGTDSFTYKAHDGSLESTPVTVTFTVRPVNDVPVAANDVYTVNEDTVLTVPAGALLVNDYDADGDALRAVLADGPRHGTLTLNANGSFSYTPEANFNGVDSFTYRASDGSLMSAVATVTITVNPVNDAPTLPVIEPQVAIRGRPFTLAVAASDVDGDRLTYQLEPGAPAGAILDANTGQLRWTPAVEQGGRTHTLTVRVTDSGSPPLSATRSFTLFVRNPGRIQFSTASFRAQENAGQALVTITRTEGDSGGVAATYSWSDIACSASGSRALSHSGTVTFNEGESQKTVTLPVQNDDLVRLGCALELRLAAPTGGAELGTALTATVQIEDDDLPLVPDRPRPGTLGQAALEFAKSREQYTNLVTAAYERYLKRTPDETGRNSWVSEMLAGRVTEEKLEAGFIGSAEYIARNGGQGRGWIVSMYQDLLGREPSEAEVQGWLDALARGTTEVQVAFGFAASRERQSQRVQRNYRTYLDREVSSQEVSAWVELFAKGQATNQDIIAGFIGSPEYYQSATKGRGNPAVWIVKAYEQVLFRSPGRAEVTGWLQRLN